MCQGQQPISRPSQAHGRHVQLPHQEFVRPRGPRTSQIALRKGKLDTRPPRQSNRSSASRYLRHHQPLLAHDRSQDHRTRSLCLHLHRRIRHCQRQPQTTRTRSASGLARPRFRQGRKWLGATRRNPQTIQQQHCLYLPLGWPSLHRSSWSLGLDRSTSSAATATTKQLDRSSSRE